MQRSTVSEAMVPVSEGGRTGEQATAGREGSRTRRGVTPVFSRTGSVRMIHQLSPMEPAGSAWRGHHA